MDIEPQDREKRRNISIYIERDKNDCSWKKTVYMEVTASDQILHLESPISAKMSGMKWSCSYCSAHDNNSE